MKKISVKQTNKKNEWVKKSETGSLRRPVKETNVWQMWWRNKAQIASGMKET